VGSAEIAVESDGEAGQSTAELATALLAPRRSVRVAGLRGAARAVWVAQLARAHGRSPAARDRAEREGRRRVRRRSRVRARRSAGHGAAARVPALRHAALRALLAAAVRGRAAHGRAVRWLASANKGAGAEPAPIVVAPWTALAPRVPTREHVRGRTVHLELGQTIDRDALVATLVGAGYARMPLVEERGEIAVRGGILDVFPPHRAAPVRIELLGDEVESIREFDPASQRSQTPLGHVVAPPPRDLCPTARS
jgi:transcription-repair coupling factor (superfamily II helicase)